MTPAKKSERGRSDLVFTRVLHVPWGVGYYSRKFQIEEWRETSWLVAWFSDGQATWAGPYYGKERRNLNVYLCPNPKNDTLFKQPEQWKNSKPKKFWDRVFCELWSWRCKLLLQLPTPQLAFFPHPRVLYLPHLHYLNGRLSFRKVIYFLLCWVLSYYNYSSLFEALR